MKKVIFPSITAFVLVTMIIAGCNKNVTGRTTDIAALAPGSNDLNAGTWKPVLLAAPTDIVVPAPAAVTTPDYIAQINEIKTWQWEMTKEEKDLVKYWSAGAVLRWNEIMRTLVAK